MKRALISVTDKTGVVEFAKGLEALDFEIVSTGGTLKALVDGGVKAISIEDVTGFPEILDGRVKTLHPKVHGGILYKRDNPAHLDTIEKHEIHSIDLVCCNLYAFDKYLAQGADLPTMVENIDIGGPSMIRSSAKNFKDVLIVTEPEDYKEVLNKIKNEEDDFAYRMSLAYKAYDKTAKYDTMIANYFKTQLEK